MLRNIAELLPQLGDLALDADAAPIGSGRDSNWPSPRHYAWQTLLRARAIENLCYGIGVNRVGTDGNKHAYLGGSVVLDPLGQPLVECGAQPQVVTTTISADVLRAHRERFPFHLDADTFALS